MCRIVVMGKRRFTEREYERDPWFRALCSVLSSTESEEEVAEILRDIGTLSELQAWSERLEVAKQLAAGLTYRQISANTGASTTTVTRVAKFLENGKGGYKKYLRTNRKRVLEKRFEEPESVEGDKLKKYL